MAVITFTPFSGALNWGGWDMVGDRLTFVDTIFESDYETTDAQFFRLHFSDTTLEYQGSGLTYTFENGEVSAITGGRITGTTVTAVNGGQMILEATGLSVEALEFSQLLLEGNSTGLFNLLLTGNDLIRSGYGADRLVGYLGDDIIRAGAGSDALWGESGRDRLFGEAGSDRLNGGGGNDRLDGGTGSDSLNGGEGNDLLTGGRGRDVMAGGGGADVFVFLATGDSATLRAEADVIADFQAGTDRIDLRGIDAFAPTVQNEALIWVGTAAFADAAAGEVRYRQLDRNGTRNDQTMIEIDVDGDSGAEMVILLTGLHDLSASDFLL